MKRRSFVKLGAQLAGAAAALPLLHGCGGGDEQPLQAQGAGRRRILSGGQGESRLYAAASGQTIHGGRHASALLELIANAPANSWVQLNQNALHTVFPYKDFIPLYTPNGPGDPSSVLRCWSGFAWDSRRSRLIIYGGGHANYDGNEVYVFDGTTRQWILGFMPTDVVDYDTSRAERITVDGSLNSPVSAHTYDNNGYLEVLDRFMTFGGACAHTGGAYSLHVNGVTRSSGPYQLDLSLAGQGMVAGLSGSNVHRSTSANVNLAGAGAWSVRDWYLDHPDPNGALPYLTEHISCGTAYTQENGHDVVYLTSRPGLHLHRVEFVDGDYRNDIITRAGHANNLPPQWDNTLALDPVRRIILIAGETSSNNYLWGWDISGPAQSNFRVPAAGISGPGAAAFFAAFQQRHGLEFDALNNRFVMWGEGGQVFGFTHTGGALTSGWYCEELRQNIGTAGLDRPKTRAELDAETQFIYSKSDTSTLGKWKWAKDLNAFVALQHTYAGNVWVYKPENWVAPTAG